MQESTLLDWYAGQALAGLCASRTKTIINSDDFVSVAFELALMMLSRRNLVIDLLKEETDGNQSV